MKHYLSILLLLFFFGKANAQLTIASGARWVSTGNVVVTMQDMNLVNNGTFTPGNSTMKFTGNATSNVGGSASTTFYNLAIEKSGGNSLSLLTNVNVSNKVSFISGLLNLNQKNLVLAGNAFLENETESSRITGLTGGEVVITLNMNAPNAVNAGNLGAVITSSSNLKSVTIRRGHKVQSGTGLPGSIQRYYAIQPGSNNYQATLRFRYFDDELNGQAENAQSLFSSSNNGSSWTNQSFTARDAAANWVEKTGLRDLSFVTLGADNTPPPPPPAGGVTGLTFTATRKKATEVQLTWSTQTETSMSGFEVQRRNSNEADFSVRAFVNSKANGGNSNSKLSYSYVDANPYTDTSYYRLRIVDNTGAYTYSEVRAVYPKGKGGGKNNKETADASTQAVSEPVTIESIAKITVGPNPNNGYFWFRVAGIEKETTATLYTMDGKVVKQFRVFNQQQYNVNGLGNGIYLLKVPGIETFKIIVQGSGNSSTVNPSAAGIKY